MGKTVTFYISDSRIEYCESLIETGEFDNISSVVYYSMHIFYDYIRIKGIKSKHLKRNNQVKRAIRVNKVVLDGIMETNFFTTAEIADYSIDFLAEWRNRFTDGGIIVD